MSYLPYASQGVGSWMAASGSSIVAHVLVAFAIVGGTQQLLELAATPAVERPDFVVTLDRLDTDTIAMPLDNPELEAITPEPEEPDEVAALAPEALQGEAPEAAEPEVIEPEVPEAQDQPEAEIPEDLVPEVPEGLVAETVEAATPDEALGAVDGVDALTPEPVTPEASTPETLTAETMAALDPLVMDSSPIIPETVTSVSPVTQSGVAPVSPVAPEANATINPVAPAGNAPTVAVVPVSPDVETVASVTTQPPPAPAPRPAPVTRPPSEQDLALADLIRRIRTTPADACLVALPRRDGPEGVGVEIIAASDTAMSEFSDSFFTPEDADVRQTRTLIDDRQCPALAYMRDNEDYPATRLGVALDSATVASSSNLTGILRGIGGRYLTLMLVDNNGVAQDLQRFLSFSGDFARLDVPVTRAGPLRDTNQMLLAIATDRPAPQLKERAGQLAQDVFNGLDGQAGGSAALALVTFEVR